MRFPDNFYRHIYYGETKISSFHLDDSGRLLYFVWKDVIFDGREGSAIHTEEECLAIAKDFLLNNISSQIDFADYTIETITHGNSDGYDFVLRKYLNDCATTEQMTVCVRKNGSFFSYSSFMFGKFSADDMPKIDQDKLVQVVEKKLDTIYQDAKGKYAAVNYGEPKIYITLLEDETPAVYCTVSVCFEDGQGGSFSELTSLLIT
jgi:hypothetical protein